MIDKIITVLAGLSFIYADVFAVTHYPLASTVAPYPVLDNRRAYPTTPAPIYEENMEELPIQSSFGSQQRQLFHVLNTPYQSTRRSDNTVNIGYNRNPYSTQAVQNHVLFQPAYNPPEVSNRGASPVTYTTHTHSSPLVNLYSGPLVASTYGHFYPSHAPVASQATITFSKAPVVSHATFSGHGTSFAW